MNTDERKRKKKAKRFFTKNKLIVIGILLILVSAELFRSNFFITAESFEYAGESVPKGFDGCVIVQVSDYHNQSKSFCDRLVERVSEQSPDYIFITGDIADSQRTKIDNAKYFLEKISKVAGCFLVWGNHDYNITDEERNEMNDCAERNGITVLESNFATVSRNGDNMLVVGTSSHMDSVFTEEMMKDYPEEKMFTVWLHHYPEDAAGIAELSKNAGSQADLLFCGHAHGGLVRIPVVLKGLIAPGQGLFPEYTSGRYDVNGTALYVSRGVGNSGFTKRMGDSFHIVVCTLRSE